MPATTTPDQDAALERELSRLKAEYEKLRDEKVRAEQSLDLLEAQLKELEAKAQAEYGTADPEALARMLDGMRAENRRLVEEYRAHVARVRAGLEELESRAEG